ncbi:MAG TPA: hypothetical protein VHC18_23615 [Amycolatopsis sp.]|nr:hypothetical protein [Amycolatopsis sp.]
MGARSGESRRYTAGLALRSYGLAALLLVAAGLLCAGFGAPPRESGPYMCGSSVMRPGDLCLVMTDGPPSQQKQTYRSYDDMVAQRNEDNAAKSIPWLAVVGRILASLGIVLALFGLVVYLRRRRQHPLRP